MLALDYGSKTTRLPLEKVLEFERICLLLYKTRKKIICSFLLDLILSSIRERDSPYMAEPNAVFESFK